MAEIRERFGPMQAPMASTLGVVRPDSHLCTGACLTGNGLDLHSAVVDLRDLQLKQALYQFLADTGDLDDGLFLLVGDGGE